MMTRWSPAIRRPAVARDGFLSRDGPGHGEAGNRCVHSGDCKLQRGKDDVLMNQVLNVSSVENLRSALSRSSAAPGERTLDMQARAASLLAELRATCDRLFAKFGETQMLGEDPPPVHPTGLGRASPDDFTAAQLKQLLRMRARRRSRSNDELFEWPAWDMLLDLAAVRVEGGHVSVSAVCISSGAPQSTALRKLAALESAQLVRRYSHGKDRRRVCITLSDEALDMVDSTLREEAAFFQGIG
jgi:hypothetical protein